MKFPTSVCLSLMGVVVPALRSSAFVAPSHRRIATVYGVGGSRAPQSAPCRNLRRRRGSVVDLNMIFGDLFRGLMNDGGAFAAGIDYSALDHPGPELASAAEAKNVLAKSERDPTLELATFAGGCFWGLELAYQRIPGVVHTATGYTQGREKFPNYSQVGAGATGHTEAVVVYYDSSQITYGQLLDAFFGRVDPTTVNGQGNDFGGQYRTGVYFHTAEQEALARARFKDEQLLYSKPIATELRAAMSFWPAEKYHQQYLEKRGQNADKGAIETIRCYG